MIDEKDVLSFEEVLNRNGFLIYKTKGFSMWPLLHQNRDLIYLEKKSPDLRCKRLDTVLFKRENGQYVLHRILKVREDDYWIVGDNCISGEYVNDSQILATMSSVKRNGKLITTSSKKYLLYVHLWCDFYPIRFFLIRLYWFARGIVKKVFS